MTRYFFSVSNCRSFNDTDGLELPDLPAARAEAIGFARDLMRMEPERREWSSWAVCVTDETHKPVLKLGFREVA
jgi:hypothetical protein